MDLLNLFKNAEELLYFEAGETIFSEGDTGDRMYVVINGEVEVHVGDELFDTEGPGDLVGEMALIDAKPRSATALAKTDCQLAPVNEKHFLFMVQQTPFFALHVMRVLVDRLRRMDARQISSAA